MLERIETWRTKPTPVKQRYALTTAIIVTLIVAGVWSTTLPSRLAVFDFSNSNDVLEAEKPSVEPGIVPPEVPNRFSMFTARVIDGFTIIKEKVTGNAPAPTPEPAASTTPMVWNEVVEAVHEPVVSREGKPILITVATSTMATDTEPRATTTAEGATTTNEAVIQ